MSCWEGLNICIAAVVGGLHFGSLDGAGRGDLQLWGSMAVPSRRSRQQGRETLTVAAGHIAAAPAAPFGLEAGGSVSGGDAEETAELRRLRQHDMVRHLLLQGEVAVGEGAALPTEGGPPAPAIGQPLAAGTEAAPELRWGEARQQWLAGTDAAATQQQASCGKIAVLDSPSEMCASPQAAGWPQQQAQQAHQHGAGGSGGWAAADSATQAALREAAAAAAALGPAVGTEDFMHPSRWVEARQQQDGRPGSRCNHRSDSTSTQSGGTSSVHSFLLPGRRFSSEDDSHAGGEPCCVPQAAPLLRPRAAAPATATATGPSGGCLQLRPEPGGHSVEQRTVTAGLAVTWTAVSRAEDQAESGGAAAAGADADAALPLFGRGDHEQGAARQLSAAQRLQLALRALQLLALFLPFLLLGSLLLLLAAQLDSAAARQRHRLQQGAPEPQLQGQQRPVEQQVEQQELLEVARAAAAGAGAVRAAPPSAESTTTAAASRLRTRAFKLLLGACRRRRAGRAARAICSCASGVPGIARRACACWEPVQPAGQPFDPAPPPSREPLQRRRLHQVGPVGLHPGGHLPAGAPRQPRAGKGGGTDAWEGGRTPGAGIPASQVLTPASAAPPRPPPSPPSPLLRWPPDGLECTVADARGCHT